MIKNNIDNEEISTLIQRVATDSDMCIVLIDLEGKTIYGADVLKDCLIHKMATSEYLKYVEEASNSVGGMVIERFNRQNFKNHQYTDSNYVGDVPSTDEGMLESIILTQLIKDKNSKQYAVLINSNITPVNSTVQTIRSQFFIVTLFMVSFALFLAVIISKIVATPIVKINNASKRLAKGDYTADFETDGYREIAELGDTLNYASCELSKVDHLQKDLIANISHDLRTPLTMIIGYSEVMRDLPGENTPENVQVVIDEAKRLTTLVNDVLDISKFQSGNQKLNIKKYNLTQSIRDIVTRYEKLLEQKEFHVIFDNPDCDIFVDADETRICQVLYNLINNAITYTGEDKIIKIRQIVLNDENEVKIEIEDSGDGIEPDKLKDIWDRYYKVDKSHKRAEIGTGLGLSIVKSIIQLHGGRYGVKSTLGAGSVFWFSLNFSDIKTNDFE